jgi:hypothetical protein
MATLTIIPYNYVLKAPHHSNSKGPSKIASRQSGLLNKNSRTQSSDAPAAMPPPLGAATVDEWWLLQESARYEEAGVQDKPDSGETLV